MTKFADALKAKLQGKKRKPVVFSGTDEWFHAEMLPCGIAGIDWILGGGLAYGRLSELFGNFSSGKTYLLYLFLAMNQRMGGVSALFESEFAYDADFYRAVGGDPESLLIRPARTIQEVFDGMAEIAKHVATEGKDEKVAIGWDGIAATGTKHLQDVGMEKRDMSKAAGMSQGTQYITDLIGESQVAVIATNQTREKIGDDTYDPMRRTHTPGGKAWPFHSSQRLELEFRGGFIRQFDPKAKDNRGKEPIGHWVRARVDKNKLAPPHLSCSLPFYSFNDEVHPVFGTPTRMGIDYAEALLEFYKDSRFRLVVGEEKRPVISTSGGWYRFDESLEYDKSFHAKDFPSILEERPDLWQLAYAKQTEVGGSGGGLDAD
jgi:RecA/RadA recombinase